MHYQKRNLHSLVFLCALFYSLYMCEEKTSQWVCGLMTVLYFLQDFFIHPPLKRDMVCHHVLGTLLVCSSRHSNWDEIVVVYETEWSTIFLVLMSMNICTSVSTPLFVVSFFYFRIYRLTVLLLNRADYTLVNLLVACLFGLNMYWQYCIIRKIIRSLRKKRNHQTIK
jgi:hypothetical protein